MWGNIAWTIDLSSNVALVGGLSLFSLGFRILNTSGTVPLSATVGSDGIDLDTDGRLDVTTIGVRSFFFATADAVGSTISGAGSDATGGSFDGSLFEQGGIGDDVLIGGASSDIIAGGPGADSIDGGAGRDYVEGGRGNDQIDGGGGGDVIKGGTGDDIIDGGDGRDRCTGGVGDDVIRCEVERERVPMRYEADAVTLFAAFVRRDFRRAAVRLWTMPFDAALSNAREVSSA